ncbi:hypothetical protein BD310DRAFT_924906 [Dichomitus squalens]|uniref:Uncharacterized protein n=1 Tax=Dichomitus squalens TaxID=114155 RepID=A0A4Q9PYB7_9APHY|nr:hypothetical protein BD310DRAFT_924906 [Dichomitus squalens]
MRPLYVSMRGHIYDSSSFGRLRPRRRVVAKRPTVQLSRINEDDPVYQVIVLVCVTCEAKGTVRLRVPAVCQAPVSEHTIEDLRQIQMLPRPLVSCKIELRWNERTCV